VRASERDVALASEFSRSRVRKLRSVCFLPSIWPRRGGGGEEVTEKEFPERTERSRDFGGRASGRFAALYRLPPPPLSFSLSRFARARFISAFLVILVKNARGAHSGGMSRDRRPRNQRRRRGTLPGEFLASAAGSCGCAEDLRRCRFRVGFRNGRR